MKCRLGIGLLIVFCNSVLFGQDVFKGSNGKYGLETNDSVIVQPFLDSVIAFDYNGNSLFWCSEAGYEGVLDDKGEFVIPYDYTWVGSFTAVGDSIIQSHSFGEILFFSCRDKIGFRNLKYGYTTPCAIDDTQQNRAILIKAIQSKDKKVQFYVDGKLKTFHLVKGILLD